MQYATKTNALLAVVGASEPFTLNLLPREMAWPIVVRDLAVLVHLGLLKQAVRPVSRVELDLERL